MNKSNNFFEKQSDFSVYEVQSFVWIQLVIELR